MHFSKRCCQCATSVQTPISLKMKWTSLILTLACCVCCTIGASTVGPVTDASNRELLNPTPCTTPKQWEGRFSEWNHTAATNNRYLISYDGVKKRKYIEEERKSMRPGRRLFKFLIFFDEQMEYKIDPTHNVCTKIPMGPWRNFSIPPNAILEDQYQIGGPQGKLNVSEWSDRQPSRSRETWIGGFTDIGCWPVFDIISFMIGNASQGYTTRFFDQTPGIKNMSVFDVPAICKSAATVAPSPQTPTKEPGLWEKWAPNWLKGLFGAQRIDNGGVVIPDDTPTVAVPVAPGPEVSYPAPKLPTYNPIKHYNKLYGAKLPWNLRKP